MSGKSGFSRRVAGRIGAVAAGLLAGTALLPALADDGQSASIHASLKGAMVEDAAFMRDIALSRLDAGLLRFGGVMDTQPAGWAESFGNWGESHGGDVPGLDRSTGGVVLGAETGLGYTGRVGVMAGYQGSEWTADGRDTRASADTFWLGAYGGAAWGGLGLTGGAAYGWSDLDTSRKDGSDRLEGSTAARTGQVFGEVNYTIELHGISFQPYAGLAYVSLETDGYDEHGGTGALQVAGDTTDTTFSTLGMRLGHRIDIGQSGHAQLSGGLGWRHAYDGRHAGAEAGLPGLGTQSLQGTPIAEDAALVEAGITFDLGQFGPGDGMRAKLGLGYAGQYAAHATDNSARADLSFAF